MTARIVSVAGPTASGKTALSVMLAKKLDAHVVSLDSMQIYRGMDIGTAKVRKEEMIGVPHHMIDCVFPSQNYNVRTFITEARKIVDNLITQGISVVLVGGTGLYLDHLLADTQFADMPENEQLRRELSTQTSDALYDELAANDPESAKRLHINDRKRIIRALEVYRLTGKTIGDWNRQSHLNSRPLDCLQFGLFFSDRQFLYRRIDQRVDMMMKEGLLDEVARLRKIDGFLQSTAAAAIGYKELIGYFDGLYTYEQAVEMIKLHSRRYAKRQMTWFRRNASIHWLDATVSTQEQCARALEIFYGA